MSPEFAYEVKAAIYSCCRDIMDMLIEQQSPPELQQGILNNVRRNEP
jgi:hypothetical protein